MRNYLLLPVILFILFSCNQESKKSESLSNEWELAIVDSIQVDHLGRVDGLEFNHGKGVLFNFKENKLLEFDESGKILHEQSYPFDGPDKVFYPVQLKYDGDGKLYGSSFLGWLYEFNSDLTFKREIKLPFLTEAKDGGGILRSMDLWKDKLIMWYPGRDGANPYDPFFFRDHFLLEKVDPITGSAEPIIRIPASSRYSSDNYYERTWVNFGILGDTLFLSLTNEPLIHLYDLNQKGKYLSSLNFQPSKFEDNGEHSKEYEYISGIKMKDGRIKQLFPTQKGIVITYTEGITEDIFIQNELKDPKNFPLYPKFENQVLKIVKTDGSLSNEIIIPNQIGRMIGLKSLDEPFYAVRNDEFIGEEKDFITFYKLQLKRK